MKSKRQKSSDKIFELFQGALEVEQDRRAAFLDRECGHDEELRKEVEALLLYDKRAERFIESPAIEEAPELIADDEDSSTVTIDAVGPFKLVRKLGSGGMGEVYLARDSRLGRNVAVKLLDRNLIADSGSRMRFLREARLASALDHPNICTIHEIGEDSGLLYIAMQYVEGETLKQVIGSQPLAVDSLLSMSLQVSNALAAAHTQGIIHRDIKSSNIMVTPGGQAKVLDFGLARPLEREADDSELTHAGAVMGTPTYMSPEQARGERTDHRSDIFSLGVVMYEMATGRTPFKCKSREQTMNAVIHQPHTPVAELNKEMPSELCAVIDKALAKQADDRYQSVGDLTNELRRVAKTVVVGYNSSDPLMVPYVPPPSPGGSARKRGSATRRWQVTALCLLVLIVAAIIYAAYFRNASSLSAGEIKSLVVLPLENLSGDPSQEYFADGMTDALIGDLAKIRGLQVISRTSSMHYKGTKQPLNEIARELKVDAVVEGTVQRSGDRVRVRAQLIRSSTDQHLWSETYERDLRDVLALESEIAQAVVREIQMKITPDEQARLSDRVEVNRKALDDYLQGTYLLGRKEQLHRAIEYFQSALTQDPNYAPAYAGLAASYNTSQSVVISELPPPDARRQAEEAAVKALQLDGTLAEAHAALGYVYHYDWNWISAEQELKRAIELNPNSAQAHSIYSLHLSANEKRAGEAIAEADRAQALDPLSLSASTLRGFVLTNARRYDEAIEQLRRVIALDPNNYLAHWFLGAAYAADRRFDEAIATSERAVVLSGRAPGALGLIGMCYGLAGRKAEAVKILNELIELNRHRYVTPAALVYVHIGLGAKDQAFAWLEKAYQERSNFMAYLKVQAITESLRSDPRFDDLLRRMGI